MRVGVVIRTLNESEHIGRCLETLRRQEGDFDLDILVVDSGSTDATIEIAREHGARIIELLPGDFDYSKALNAGIEAVDGEIVVSLSAHAIPVDDEWLVRMTAPFAEAGVAGVACRQVPWPGAQWSEVHRLRYQFPQATSRYSTVDVEGIVFSNAASAVRRRVWNEERFTLPAAEDLEWAQRVIAAGWTIVYESAATVYHSHRENPRAQALRMIDINRVLDGETVRRNRLRTIREAGGIFFRDSRKIVALDEPLHRKFAYLIDLARMVWFYVLDFSRSGTTAERRGAADAAERGSPARL